MNVLESTFMPMRSRETILSFGISPLIRSTVGGINARFIQSQRV